MNISLNIKKTLIVFVLFAGFISISMGQQGKNKERIKDKIKSHQVAFITEKLDLTETEAQKFWPIYNSYQEEKEQLRASLDLNPRLDMTDQEAEKMMYAMLDGKTKEINIQKKYIEKMKVAISPKKIALLFKAEREFKEELISNIKERRKNKLGQ